MAGDFVASRGDVSDKLRVPLGHPSQHKKSPSNVKLLEDFEQSMSVADHARFARGPTIAMYVRRQSGYVKIVLYVYGKRVAYARSFWLAADMISLPWRVSPPRRLRHVHMLLPDTSRLDTTHSRDDAVTDPTRHDHLRSSRRREICRRRFCYCTPATVLGLVTSRDQQQTRFQEFCSGRRNGTKRKTGPYRNIEERVPSAT